MNLEPIDPETAVELYLADREAEVAKATLYSHSSRLSHFVRWCDEEEIDNLNELSGRSLHEYRLWRRCEGDLAPATEKTQMDTLRVFINWLESIDAVVDDLHTKVRSPVLRDGQNVRDVMLESDRAEEVLSYLAKYEYASRQHVVLALMWHTMMRTGAVHSLDVDDYDSDGQYIAVVHRPETGTTIKNGVDGERLIALSNGVCGLIDDWIANRRPDVDDEFGRRPLVSTSNGRAHRSTLRGDCYRYTRPCISTGECPHDRDPDDCGAMVYTAAFDCPSSVSPHALRRGGITHHLNNDVPKDVVSDRANVTPGVLDEHYDRRSQRKRMEQRRGFLDNI
ncbi:site-specific integrase [Halorubrum sp. SP9]|uniref:tyrosine-type recombinase/integrase n=1 Tax=Halorubrum sp. SP9 TaxID=1537267 RepID=UPI0010F6F64F|nr:site-specific integrase [Halorubrum sp. SP9]TKX68836.1 site-specific integrase [Halorubrum sp. SP9]